MHKSYLIQLLILVLLINSCSIIDTKENKFQDNQSNRSVASIKPNRIINNELYDNVGMILKDNKSFCTGTVIKHGVFLTAKHCFSGRQFGGEGLKHFSLAFTSTNNPPENPLIVTSENLVRVFPDEGFNDLAYILYNPKITSDKLKIILQTSDFLNFEESLTNVNLVGFPKLNEKYKYPQKVISQGCSLGEISGRFLKYPKSLHYRGDLLDTTCSAYYGNSGGPAVAIKLIPSENGFLPKINLIGVVAHTFNDDKATQQDEIGTFVDNANISPLRDAKSLDYIMKLDINSLSDSTFLGNIKTTLGTPEIQISILNGDPKKLPSLFYPTKIFWKQNRDQNQINKKRLDYDSKYLNYQSKCPTESYKVNQIFNQIVIKNNLKQYLSGSEDGLKMYIDCNNLGLDGGAWYGAILMSKGMINTLKTNGAIACFISHELSHHILKHDQNTKNEIFNYRKELDADSLGVVLAINAEYSKDECRNFLKLTTQLDVKVAGDMDPYPSSYERLQNFERIINRK